MKKFEHLISSVIPGSIANEMEIEAGDVLLSINGHEIEDIFDYQYYVSDEEIEVLIRKEGGEEWLLEIEKDEDEDLGIVFDNGLMDHYRRCSNSCIFCFIDQNPPGMRESLYFKDDDSRLSFLQGNYVTLTNMSDHDVERICHYNLSPINISFHTMNPELRCKMLGNRFAGDALKKVDVFFEHGITMNGQIVLCPNINDGKELRYTLEKLLSYVPVLQSVSVVPVGLTKFREGLYPLTTFDKESSGEVIDLIEEFQKRAMAEHGTHFVHASDEWYIVAGREMPEEARYDGYLQLENGVGVVRLQMNEFEEYLETHYEEVLNAPKCRKTIICGTLIYPYNIKMAERLTAINPNLDLQIVPIINHFFGEGITVTGLLTGGDIVDQLRNLDLGSSVLMPTNVLRSGDDVFLDDMTLGEVQNSLQVPIRIVKSSGYDMLQAMIE